MNNLIKKEFFQFILNKFLVLDKDLIPWKLTCTDCFYYFHKIHINSLQFKYPSLILDFVDPIEINTVKYLDTELIDDTCCDMEYYRPNFDNRIFNSNYLTHITTLILNFTFDHLKDYNISCLTTLLYLDLGRYNSFTNDAIIPLCNLEKIYLRNNHRITSEIFKYLPKLTLFQCCKESGIKLKDIPETVTTVLVSSYHKICEICDIYDYEIDTKQLR